LVICPGYDELAWGGNIFPPFTAHDKRSGAFLQALGLVLLLPFLVHSGFDFRASES
jgi:hypothetical protein